MIVEPRSVLKNYLESNKQIINRGGNGLKTPKFHQMLHVCDYIQRHGSPLNYDGSRGENFGKVKIKDNAKLTRKQKGVFNFDISHRISEEDIIDNASNIFQQNKGYWPSGFCNDTDIVENVNRIQNHTGRTENTTHRLGNKRGYKILIVGKVKIKDNAKLTRKQKGVFNFDIGHRISEEDVIDNASNIFQQNKGYWPSEFCNDSDIAGNVNRIQSHTGRTENTTHRLGHK